MQHDSPLIQLEGESDEAYERRTRHPHLDKITSWREPPNHDRMTQFKCIHNVEDKIIVIWQMGTLLNKLAFPRVWCYYEYWDDESYERASQQMRFTTGLLNGIRQPSEIVGGLEP